MEWEATASMEEIWEVRWNGGGGELGRGVLEEVCVWGARCGAREGGGVSLVSL